MCGIVGFKTSGRFQLFANDLRAASMALSHRGPDDSGIFTDRHAGVGLAHRRLSVIDLSPSARQPMGTEDGKVQIVYNGEVYNFGEIRKILEQAGHTFKTRSDTEVVLKAYLQWGTEAFGKFVGMFALAIWDGRNDALILARDRLGIKPLYYHFKNGTLLFSSELKAMMAFKGFSRELDPDAVAMFFHYQYIPSPRTIFKDTYKLLPGHWAIFEGNSVRATSYWDPGLRRQEANDNPISEQEAIEALEMLLHESISDRLISDVPLGALLSGGIDSSIVVSLMQKVSSSPVRTFSIGFEEKEYDEAPWASQVARHLGTDHMEFYVTPREAIDVIPRLSEIYDEPFADSSAIPTFLVCRLARSYVTVALSGDGGDEQFCGYVRYWATDSFFSGSFSKLPSSMRIALGSILEKIPLPLATRCHEILTPRLPKRFRIANFLDKWQKLIALSKGNNLIDFYRTCICIWPEEEVSRLARIQLKDSLFEACFKESSVSSTLSCLMEVDKRTYLPDCMLTKVDRASMAVGLEVRVPLLDHRIVEFSSRLPDSLKYRNGSGKYLLRKLLAKYVPPELFNRPKMGFGVPIGKWFRKELKELLLDYLSPDRLRREGLFNMKIVEDKVREHLSGRSNHQYRLWSLLMWEMWRERWLNDH